MEQMDQSTGNTGKLDEAWVKYTRPRHARQTGQTGHALQGHGPTWLKANGPRALVALKATKNVKRT